MKQWVKILLACLLVIVVIAGVGFYMLKYHRQTVKTMAKQLLDEVPAENASKATNPPEEIRASSAQALIEAWDGSFDDALQLVAKGEKLVVAVGKTLGGLGLKLL